MKQMSTPLLANIVISLFLDSNIPTFTVHSLIINSKFPIVCTSMQSGDFLHPLPSKRLLGIEGYVVFSHLKLEKSISCLGQPF